MLKLAKLPDRTPVKLTVTVSPELHKALRDYADLYHQAYGQKEPIEDLVPFMLQGFLDGDKAFRRARNGLALPKTDSANQSRR